MKPARKPAFFHTKPCASSLKKRHSNLDRSALLIGPQRKKKNCGQKSAFLSETSWCAPLILAHKSSQPLLARRRSSFSPPSENTFNSVLLPIRLSVTVPPASRVHPSAGRQQSGTRKRHAPGEYRPLLDMSILLEGLGTSYIRVGVRIV